MPSVTYLMLRSAPFETPPAGAPQDKRARLEARTTPLPPNTCVSSIPSHTVRRRPAIAHEGFGSVWRLSPHAEPLDRIVSCAARATMNLAFGLENRIPVR